MSADLRWRSVTPSHSHRFLVKGTEIAQAIIPGTLSRFALAEVRTIEADRMPGVRYSVRDAETVSDADIRAGKQPHQVASFGGIDEALAWAAAQ